MNVEIPAEYTIPLLGRTIDIHWTNHAWLMFIAWGVLVPLALIAIRYGKPRPRPCGIPRGTPKVSRDLFWWVIHRFGLYAAMGLALGGGALAVTLSGGFSGSLHAVLGLAALALGALQIVSAWLRGSHGGPNNAHSDPEEPATWRGDHYDMTPQRRWFEAWHKTSGYFALALATGAILTGLSQHWVPGVAIGLAIVVAVGLALAILGEGLGLRHDTYHSVYGTHPDHPGNRRRP